MAPPPAPAQRPGTEPAAEPTAKLFTGTSPEPTEPPAPTAGLWTTEADEPQSEYEPADYNRPTYARPRLTATPEPDLSSPDGRFRLTDTHLTVRGQTFLLLEVERLELTPVRWLLWYLLGALGLAFVIIAYLDNRLRTGPFALGLVLTAALFLYGRRGANRLRVQRPGQEAVNFSLPGDAAAWQRLCAAANRRIGRAHDLAAQDAADALGE